jgi:hypothetical protein
VSADDEAIELLRERSGLSIDREGRFLHLGEPITHARTLEVLWRSLERTPEGRYLVRIGRESGYVAIEDAPYLVLGIVDGSVVLNDGTREAFAPASLTLDREGVFHCRVKGDHRARFSRSAQVGLGLSAEEDPSSPGGWSVAVAGKRYPIGQE